MFEWLFACKAEPWDPRVMSLSLTDFYIPYVLLDVFMFRLLTDLSFFLRRYSLLLIYQDQTSLLSIKNKFFLSSSQINWSSTDDRILIVIAEAY